MGCIDGARRFICVKTGNECHAITGLISPFNARVSVRPVRKPASRSRYAYVRQSQITVALSTICVVVVGVITPPPRSADRVPRRGCDEAAPPHRHQNLPSPSRRVDREKHHPFSLDRRDNGFETMIENIVGCGRTPVRVTSKGEIEFTPSSSARSIYAATDDLYSGKNARSVPDWLARPLAQYAQKL